MSNYLTIRDLEGRDPNEPIWALNGSAQSEAGQAGDVHVGIPKTNGTKVDALYLPQTFLPQNLTDQIPRAQLLASSEFRNAVNTRLLILITDEYATQILNEDGASEERDRLSRLRRQVREATAARSITQGGTDILNTSSLLDPAASEAAEKATTPELSQSFIMFAENLSSKNDIETLNAIRGRGRYTPAEIAHLKGFLHDKPKSLAVLNK